VELLFVASHPTIVVVRECTDETVGIERLERVVVFAFYRDAGIRIDTGGSEYFFRMATDSQ
jgi:hypothetical protein